MSDSGIAGRRAYRLREVDGRAASGLVRELGLPDIVARLLVERGCATSGEARRFLNPSLDRDWADPEGVPGLSAVADRVGLALDRGQRICVFGDYDADGVTATTVMVRGLRALGGTVSSVLPNRFSDGYGLSEGSAARVLAQKPDLVVTVDNGISAAEQVDRIVAAGVDVVVTDHHEPGEGMPRGVPVADPHLDPSCPSVVLAGVGVALKLVQLLGRRHGMPDLWRSLVDVAALGTIADQMPLRGENRALVAEGVRVMSAEPSPAITAFQKLSRRRNAITSENLAFSLIPCINSAGRVGDPALALDLLLSDTVPEALECMRLLNEANDERKVRGERLEREALEQARRVYHGERVLVVAGEDWDEGVKGIVASRIVGVYHVPTLLFSIADGVASGSGRSVGDVNLFEALTACSDLLDAFGGHSGACGATLPASRLDELRSRLVIYFDALPDEQFVSSVPVDLEVSLADVTLENIEAFEQLEPFGQDNPSPRFVVRDVYLRNRSSMGRDGSHFVCDVCSEASGASGEARRAVFFHPEHLDELLSCDEPVDIVFAMTRNTFSRPPRAELRIEDVLPHRLRVPDVAVSVASREQDASAARVDPSASREADRTPAGSADELVASLFSRSEEFLDRGDYADILDAASFHTKVAGVTFEGRQEVIASLQVPCELSLVREPDNAADGNAIAVRAAGRRIGYLNARLSSRLAAAMDAGAAYGAVLEQRTGGDDGRSFGANILVWRQDVADAGSDPRVLRERRRLLEACPDAELDDRLRVELLGDHDLHDAQRQALRALRAGRSTLCVMATGRGKSLIFQMYAARIALTRRLVSVFVYPLRALVADQAFHLEETFSRLGLRVEVLAGETPDDERARVFEGIEHGGTDVVLTTPEFLAIHVERFSAAGRIGFLVIDEAHHVLDRNRPAYCAVAQVRHALGDPVTLAVTATADDERAAGIIAACGVERVICDETTRDNLQVADHRASTRRDATVAQIVAQGGKTVVYVNSRTQATQIARDLRKRLPERAGGIGFYHAGLPRADRLEVEQTFRDGRLQAIVATSAFGEGVNVPDIRNVVLYHLPFGAVEFNQMSGRAGRDGLPATVHLCFRTADAKVNDKILASQAPSREDLVTLYRVLRACCEHSDDGWLQQTNATIAEECAAADRKCGLDERGVSCGINIFRELGFVETCGYASARRVRLVADAPARSLEESSRYLEGRGDIDEFKGFADWILHATPDDLLACFNRPILPTGLLEKAGKFPKP